MPNSDCALIDIDTEVYAVAGDWHGNTTYAVQAIASLSEIPVLLHTGDFGFRFHPDFIRGVDEAAEAADLTIAFVDGNHDDHDLLASLPITGGVRRVSNRIWHLPRGARWTWGGVRYLALGGASSIDRSWRVPGTEWWPAEDITDADVAACLAGGAADVMLCHDLPAGVAFAGLPTAMIPPEDLQRSAANRDRIAHVAARTGARLLWHGHHHRRGNAEGRNGLLVCGLAADGGPASANIAVRHVIDDLALRDGDEGAGS